MRFLAPIPGVVLLILLLISACQPTPEAVPETKVLDPIEKARVIDSAEVFLLDFYEAWNAGEYDRAFAAYEEPSGLFGSQAISSWAMQMAQERENLATYESFTQRLDTVTYNVVNSDVVVIHGRDRYLARTAGGEQLKGSTTFSLVIALREEGWKIVHFHVVNP